MLMACKCLNFLSFFYTLYKFTIHGNGIHVWQGHVEIASINTYIKTCILKSGLLKNINKTNKYFKKKKTT